ncbi:hypothetical protein CI610_00303 [invertebrate metagenome]|uniref:AI-2 transport protein TqsA n=1 Tax=invertebrate metagenome TaxID=1711999 RepID=A0A2H9TBT6_9ZZZZ
MTKQQSWLILAVSVLLVVLMHYLGSVLAPFVFSAVLAYLGDSLTDRLEHLGLSRTWAVLVVFCIIFAIITLILVVLVPVAYHQLKAIVHLLPAIEEWLRVRVFSHIEQITGLDPALFDVSELVKKLVTHWQKAGGIVSNMVGSITRSSLAFFALLVNLFLVPVVTFYLLRDWDHLTGQIREMIPRNLEPVVVRLLSECDSVLGAFFKGQLMVMLSLGCLYSAGLSIVGLRFSLLVGMLAGLVSIIPYMGFATGFVAAMAIALFQFDGWTPIAAVVGVFLVGQALEGWVLTPMLIGGKIGLHPVVVIFSLMAGGQLLGFTGMIIALPMAAVIMVLLRYLHQNYKASQLYDTQQDDNRK